MTRINLVPPHELFDQHLFAEWREIKMIPMSLRRSLVSRGQLGVIDMIPKEFTLNRGHVSFFYDKAGYITNRYSLLTKELQKRHVKFSIGAFLDPQTVWSSLPTFFHKDYVPTAEALKLIRERIASRVAIKPSWYRYYGEQNEGQD